MYKKFKKHMGYYLSLFLILFLGLILIFISSPNIFFQSIILLLTVFFYVLWGLMHHLINHEFTAKIMIEYVLIGLLGISIFFFFIMGGLI
ncbi:MAG TPA: hypothetical protein VES68_00085 [Candidatus Sulfotelmatobacter sp.]|nr:hypothetical protein [Candidatus Sulfotelmatobacter sp.]